MTPLVDLRGKRGLIVGIANEQSIAAGCAEAFSRCGARLAATYLNEKAKGWVEPVADRLRQHGVSKYGFLGRFGAGLVDLFGMIWLVRRGGYGVAAEWNDPRASR